MILISPYSRPLRNGVKPNPKDYPYWNLLIDLILAEFPKQIIIQVGVTGEEKLKKTTLLFDRSLDELKYMISKCDIWISVDNFFHHLAAHTDKRGIVLFGQSDPLIFGSGKNINLLKDRKYLRNDQFDLWENAKHIKESFIEPIFILNIIKDIFNN